MEEDVAGLRIMASKVDEMFIASSCSKNFGLYRERTAAAIVVAKDLKAGMRVQQHLNAVIRCNYSMPPSHGALIVQTILDDDELMDDWIVELAEMRERIVYLRKALVYALRKAGIEYDFHFIERQKGLFSFLGVSPEEVNRLINEYSIYLVSSGRINIAGLNDSNLDYFANAVTTIIKE